MLEAAILVVFPFSMLHAAISDMLSMTIVNRVSLVLIGTFAIVAPLTGMGTHHPAAYFVEAILHPDAVLIDAPGYVGSDGRSAMPSYPDLTMGTLADLVAYLGSLQTTLDGRACHASGDTPVAVTMSQLDARQRPIPAVDTGQAFFAQTYEVLPGQLAGLETWFATDGRRAFGRVPGLLRIDTFVDAARPGTAITSSFAFRDETALRNFLGDPTGADLWRQFDGFLGPHGHLALTTPLVYRAPSLSMP